MKKALLLVFALLISSSIMFAQAPVVKKGKVLDPKTKTVNVDAAPVVKQTKPAKKAKATTTTTSKTVIKGDVVNLYSAATGSKVPALNKEDAKKMVYKGGILALRSANKLYIIVMPDGVDASNKLALKAGQKVSLTGKVITKGTINLLVVDKM